jgi:serine/threonine-protein kinase
MDQLAAAKAKTIAHTAFFFEPQTDRGLVFIRKIKEALGPEADPAPFQGGLSEQLSKVIADAELALNTDAKLATSLSKAGNVLVTSVFVLTTKRFLLTEAGNSGPTKSRPKPIA